MIDISPELTTILMMGLILLGVLTGFPLAVPIGGVAVIFGYLLYGAGSIELISGRVYSLVTNYTLLAVPAFIFMGGMLEHSGIAEKIVYSS